MKVFLSYSREDSELAHEVTAALHVAGYKVFCDWESLHSASEFHAEIRKQLYASDAFVILMGPHTFGEGRYALSEIELAEKKWPNPVNRVFPVLIGDLDMDSIPGYLRVTSHVRSKGPVSAAVVQALEELRARTRHKRIMTGLVTVAAVAVIAIVAGFVSTTLIGDPAQELSPAQPATQQIAEAPNPKPVVSTTDKTKPEQRPARKMLNLNLPRAEINLYLMLGYEVGRYGVIVKLASSESVKAIKPLVTRTEREVADLIKLIKQLLAMDPTLKDVEVGDYLDLLDSIITRLKVSNTDRAACFLLGHAAQAVSMFTSQNTGEDTNELPEFAFALIKEIDPTIAPDKPFLLSRLIERNPENNSVELLKFVDDMNAKDASSGDSANAD